jgi:hypothetical protein
MFYTGSDVFSIRPSGDGLCISRNIAASANSIAAVASGFYDMPSITVRMSINNSLNFHYVGAYTDYVLLPVAQSGVPINRCVDFDLRDKKGKVMVNTRVHNCGANSNTFASRATVTAQVATQNCIFPSNGQFVACHAGWTGSRLNDFGRGPATCVGFRNSNTDPYNSQPFATYIDFMLVVGELTSLTATIPPARIGFSQSLANRELLQFLVIFVHSTAFPGYV